LVAQSITPATPVKTIAPPKSLPRTGANLPLTAGIATSLMGLAFVARRRRLAHVSA
jgi:LPXTG-motif cell wall-anchored protein